jgi:hypothetical protein
MCMINLHICVSAKACAHFHVFRLMTRIAALV